MFAYGFSGLSDERHLLRLGDREVLNGTRLAKQAGASLEEVISAILVGLPAAGQSVTQILPAAIAAYDTE